MERQKSWRRIIGSIFLLLLLSVWVSAAQAATLTVKSLSNDGVDSLRQAITNAAAGDTIVFSSSLSGKTIVLQSQLIISKSLTISSSVPITISGNNAVRVFYVASSPVVFDGLTIINGKTTEYGGGIYNMGGLTIKNSTISGNVSTSIGTGGGIFNHSSGTLTIQNSTIANNSSNYYGGGIFSYGTLSVDNSTVSGNAATSSGGGICNSGGILTVKNSTISGNKTIWGGGIYNNTSASACNETARAVIRNSTISGNTASGGGGIRNVKGLLEITRSTVSSNTANSGSGVLSSNDGATCTRIGGTIVAGNSGNDVAADLATTRYYSLNYNLIGIAGSNVDFTQEFNQANDQRGVTNPKLNALADNGGATLTHALQLGSPAIDKGGACANDYDQRGVCRPQGAACDIGAYEYDENQAVVAGELHTLAVKSNKTLWAWGSNAKGQLGNGSQGNSVLIPTQISIPVKYQAIAAGNRHSAAIKMNRTLWTWGSNGSGQLGIGDKPDQIVPVQVGTEGNWRTVTAGMEHTVAIKNDGTLWAWGDNSKGQLGRADIEPKAIIPVQVDSATNWKAVAAGNYHTVAIKTNGTLWAWGSTNYGQLGNGVVAKDVPQRTPMQIGTATNWKAVAAGAMHTVAIKTDGTLWAWGDNSKGQLGRSATIIPQQVGTATWKAVAAGFDHTVAIKTDGTLWAWGNNSSGQLGNGDQFKAMKSTPVPINNATNWQSIAAGWYHSVGIKADGTLWTWGTSSDGQLGDNNWVSYKATPMPISW